MRNAIIFSPHHAKLGKLLGSVNRQIFILVGYSLRWVLPTMHRKKRQNKNICYTITFFSFSFFFFGEAYRSQRLPAVQREKQHRFYFPVSFLSFESATRPDRNANYAVGFAVECPRAVAGKNPTVVDKQAAAHVYTLCRSRERDFRRS